MSDNYLYIDDLAAQIPELQPDSIISRTVYTDDQIKVILFAFAPGQELSEHTASVPATLHFLEGEAQLILGEDEHEAMPGTWVHMPARLPHSVYAKSLVKMLLIMHTKRA